MWPEIAEDQIILPLNLPLANGRQKPACLLGQQHPAPARISFLLFGFSRVCWRHWPNSWLSAGVTATVCTKSGHSLSYCCVGGLGGAWGLPSDWTAVTYQESHAALVKPSHYWGERLQCWLASTPVGAYQLFVFDSIFIFVLNGLCTVLYISSLFMFQLTVHAP